MQMVRPHEPNREQLVSEFKARLQFFASLDPIELAGSILKDLHDDCGLSNDEKELVGMVVCMTYTHIVGGAYDAGHCDQILDLIEHTG